MSHRSVTQDQTSGGDEWEESGVGTATNASSTNIHETTESHTDATANDKVSPIDQAPIYHVYKWEWAHIFSLTLFSIYGITIRSFLGRFFGGDCDATTTIDDWLTPFSSRICVTATGKTDQYGGALFIDLPANMFGSFIMGFLTGHSKDWPVLPWLAHDHPLQYEDGLHLGLKTALCGTITTFSSWNAQMVLMMDGTGTILGRQVAAALFGYVIGMQVAISCFRAGRTLAAWCHFKVNPHIFDAESSIRDDTSEKSLAARYRLNARIIPLVIALAIFVMYLLGDFYWKIDHYRVMWLSCLFGPFGTFMRWKLATFNGKLKSNKWQWFPVGTFLSNFIASLVSCAINAIFTATIVESWTITHDILAGIKLGFAGCLSTVSSMVKEVVEISDKNPHFDEKASIYSYGTLVSCCLFGLLVYCPIVRYV